MTHAARAASGSVGLKREGARLQEKLRRELKTLWTVDPLNSHIASWCRSLSDLKSKSLCGGRRGSERPRRIVLR